MDRMIGPVDDQVFETLQAQAEPLVDDVNAVLRRLLGLAPAPSALENGRSSSLTLVPEPPRRDTKKLERARRPKRGTRTAPGKEKKPRAPRGSILPEVEYELPILQALVELGNKAPASEVVDRVGQLVASKLQPIDHEDLASGDVRWRNRAQFVRLALIRSGDMKKDSPRGVWEITEQGARRITGAA